MLVFLAKYLLVEREGIINVAIHKNSTASDVLQSYIHALVMAKLMGKSTSVYLESQSWMDKQYEVFLQKVSLSIFLHFNKLLVYLNL